ncbi:MAG: 4Fe-4S dicluster domain-containing protein [Oscillospiraceae bacterium]|nr:4Fe-4S dicluster domain-containing protein [Oscillospiraceae bacterium]
MERDTATRQIKYEVLRSVAELVFNDELTEENAHNIPYQLIPTATPRFRCCVYKEREIIRQRVRLATGRPPLPAHNVEHIEIKNTTIQVIPAACEGCPINRFQVTENCQKCMAKSCKSACAFDAITITGRGAYIDQTKCRECGKCAEACPYHAIADLMRPCKRNCEVGAITIGGDRLANIDETKCIGCGHCAVGCPFGAISDMSQIVEVIQKINDKDTKVVAIPAPAVEGQFGPEATIGRIITALKMLGFDDVVEVALGADAVAYNEAKELIENHENGVKMTTSCCPAFVTLIRKHYPKLAEKMSNTVSPMVATVRWIRENMPGAYIVFIGPCMAKKEEAKFGVEGSPDAVMTFEELNALFDARRISVADCQEAPTEATSYGRRFSGAGGVTEAVMKAVQEMGCTDTITAKGCSGVKECKLALAMLNVDKLPEDIIEGMACEGGCMAGPGSIASLQQLKTARMKKIKGKENDNITEMLTGHDFMKVDMERDKAE